MHKRNEMGKFNLRKVYKIFLILFKLIKELVIFKPRFIYFQISPHGIAFLRDFLFVSIIKLFKVKLVYHLHGKGIKRYSKIKWKKIMYKFAFLNSDIICLSRLLTYDIKDVFFGNIHIVNNGIPEVYHNFISKTHEKKNNDIPIILFLSNLILSKGILEFIEALNLLNIKGVKFKALIVGSEADLSSNHLKNLILSKNLAGKIFYKGPKYNFDKYQILAECDLLVLPSKNECFPTVLLEAMQFQLPIISTSEAAIPEIVDSGVTGILIDKNSPTQIASNIELLINNPEYRKSMGIAGRKKYENKYRLKIFEKKLNNVFSLVLREV
jgi:glycosyltransferase involved in cell wall biosynthesis